MRSRGLLAAGTVCLLAGCGVFGGEEATPLTAADRITVRSPAFADGATIPTKHTCDGASLSPPLGWAGVPSGTTSLALVVDDPDAPRGTFVHWVVVDIPPTESASPEGGPPAGGRELPNDTGRTGYFGPCPPRGRHHYRFTVYALRARPSIEAGASVADIVAAIGRQAAARGQLTGTYDRG